MALTDDQKSQVFQLLGIPNKDTVFGAHVLMSIKGPGGELYTMKEIRSQITAAIAALTASEETLIAASLTEYLTIRNEVMTVNQSAGGFSGKLLDSEATRERCRKEVALTLGVFVPAGGFESAFQNNTATDRPSYRGGSCIR